MKNAEKLPHASGIYKITNLINGHFYIGQSKDIYDRYNRHHKYDYKKEECSHFHLYQAFKKYGLNNFKIEVIELCNPEKLNEREIYWIKYYDSYNKGYNMTEGGSFFSPKIHSKETEEKRVKTREKNKSLEGESHPRAKLSNNEVWNIRQRYRDGETSRQIYKDYENLYSFESFQQIILGTHYYKVGNIPKKEEKRKGSSKFLPQDIINIRREYYENNAKQIELAKKYNVSQTTIKDIVNRNVYKEVKDSIPNKRKRASYRLTEMQVKDIRKKAEKGISVQELASEYCIDSTAIRRCIKHQTYKNIE